MGFGQEWSWGASREESRKIFDSYALAGGALTGKYLDLGGGSEPGRLGAESARLNERNTRIAREVVAVAREIGCSPSQVALRWLMQQRGTVIPIVGETRQEQIADCLSASSIVLEPPHMKRLAEVSAIEPGFPHDFLSSDQIRGIVFGGTRARIINHRARWRWPPPSPPPPPEG